MNVLLVPNLNRVNERDKMRSFRWCAVYSDVLLYDLERSLILLLIANYDKDLVCHIVELFDVTSKPKTA